MIDIKNSSTDYLQRTSGTFNNISMLFAGNEYYQSLSTYYNRVKLYPRRTYFNRG